jgi:hypothetical protein
LTPLRLPCAGRSCQFGRANASMMPQLVQIMRGPKAGTGTSSGQASTLALSANAGAGQGKYRQ